MLRAGRLPASPAIIHHPPIHHHPPILSIRYEAWRLMKPAPMEDYDGFSLCGNKQSQ